MDNSAELSETLTQEFQEKIRTILFGNLAKWKTSLKTLSASELKQFLVQELNRMEDALQEYCALFIRTFAENGKTKNEPPPWLWDQHLQLLALLKTITESNEKLTPINITQKVTENGIH
jgi:hypothetical protein